MQCQKCRGAIPDAGTDGTRVRCPHCGSFSWFYPAVLSSVEKGAAAEVLVSEEHAACFNHPAKTATMHCDECGVFMCSLCDISVEGKHLCPKCFESGRKTFSTMRPDSFLYDTLLLYITALSFLICYLSFITAPFTLAASIFYWKKVKTPYARGRWRLVVVMILSLVQLIVAFVLLTAIFVGWSR